MQPFQKRFQKIYLNILQKFQKTKYYEVRSSILSKIVVLQL